MANGIARAPRAFLVVNGLRNIPIDCRVDQNALSRTNEFSANLALDATPGMDESFWSTVSNINVSVQATNDATLPGFSELFRGRIDEIEIDWFARSVNVRGRDSSSDLMEMKTTEQFKNLTSAEIVSEIASRVGLTADVSIPNADRVGLIYETDYDRITDQDVLFNVLVRLADREGCTFFVAGSTLIFKPADQLGGTAFTVNYRRPTPATFASGNFTRLRTTRNAPLAKNVNITVNSWRLKQKQAIKSAWSATGSVSGNSNYTFEAPNLTKQQADKIAKNRLNDITSREKTIEVDVPGDVTVSPVNSLVLTGTGTPFDQSYIISGVLHDFAASGYRMTIAGRSRDSGRTITQSS